MSGQNWAYLLRCADGTFYAGWTNDLDRRLAAHNAGTAAKYTRGRRPVALAWAGCFATRGEAMSKEVALKRLTRAEKQRLADGWPGLPQADALPDLPD
ncbi:GIY-YIG nuclease family protein [Ruminococcaceae bacterium OttesenSCG-928-D13]|nr:GIY-YIG nuclease family protein [Ruminococcaceae bacterium OttesenSCG-928-D13]